MEPSAVRLIGLLQRGAFRAFEQTTSASSTATAAHRVFHSSAAALSPLGTTASSPLTSISSAATGASASTASVQSAASLTTRSAAPPPRPGGQPAASVNPAVPLSGYERFRKEFDRVPAVPKVLGLAGAIPFLVLNPPTAHYLAAVLPMNLVLNAAAWQVSYAACIVSFLGAVNWGSAMASPLAGDVATRINNERYLWSVIPSLLAWPLAMMEPAPASLAFTILLPALYLRDRQFARLGYIPQWYLALRRLLTYAATFGMSVTASYYVNKELDRLKQLEQQAEQRAAAT